MTSDSQLLGGHIQINRNKRWGCRVHSRFPLWILLLAALLGAGFWVRSLPPRKPAPGRAGVWPWTTSAMATLYFADGQFFFPVSRRKIGRAHV